MLSIRYNKQYHDRYARRYGFVSVEEYTEQDYVEDTQRHIQDVQVLLGRFITQLHLRAEVHDATKLQHPEKEILRKHSHELDKCSYGDESYMFHLEKVQEAIQHHYKHNNHHPEHYENGIRGMNLLDVVEMFFDWCASAKKHGNSIESSIGIGQERFDISDDLTQIFTNTAKEFNLT